jgi:hypothetical protein
MGGVLLLQFFFRVLKKCVCLFLFVFCVFSVFFRIVCLYMYTYHLPPQNPKSCLTYARSPTGSGSAIAQSI